MLDYYEERRLRDRVDAELQFTPARSSAICMDVHADGFDLECEHGIDFVTLTRLSEEFGTTSISFDYEDVNACSTCDEDMRLIVKVRKVTKNWS